MPALAFKQAPQTYSRKIPAAAIRNVETVAVTKTITPVVTKTTTYHTHSEPALSVGHVQGYQQRATGHQKIAPVQFLTQYTNMNPTVGVNGPVTYTGPAVIFTNPYANSYSNGLSSYHVGTTAAGSEPEPVHHVPYQKVVSDSSGNSPDSFVAQYSTKVPQQVSLRPAPSNYKAQILSLRSIEQLQQLRAPPPARKEVTAQASEIRPAFSESRNVVNSDNRAYLSSSPYALYQIRPVNQANGYYSPINVLLSPQSMRLLSQQNYEDAHQPYKTLQVQQQPLPEPSQVKQYIQTYAMPSVSVTRFQPADARLQHNSQYLQSL